MSEINKEIDGRILRLTLVNGDQINGQVNIKRKPGYDRESDLIAADTENFLVLMNATLRAKNTETSAKFKTLFINKEHVIWASPED